MNADSMNAARARARAHREGAYRKAVGELAGAEAALARNPGDRAADVAVEVAHFSLAMAERALADAGEPIPSNSTGAEASSARALAPPPAAAQPVRIPSPVAPSEAGHAALPPEQLAAVLAAERARCVAIINDAATLGIGRAAVDAALASDITAVEFVEQFAPEEAVARRIAAG